jgi:hypothetical protein
LQGPHACVVVLHTGVAPPQSVSETQPTQAPVDGRQAGVEPVHLLVFVAEQTPHEPVGSQAGVAPAQSTSLAHARHVWVPGLQMGALPPQSAFAMQPTHVPAVARHTGVLPPQRAVFPAEHWPHAPDVSHTGVDGDAAHSTSPAQPRHVCVPASHTGVAPEHCAFVRQRTQVPVAALQTGVPPTQAVALVAEHWPHAPEDSHAGVAPPQSPSLAQARHVCVPALHTGLVPPHWVLLTQPTQLCVVVLHTGVAPPHWVAFVAEHWPHAPDGSQAGVLPPQSLSAEQRSHTCVAWLHTGVVPAHCALVTHEAQVPVAVLQTGVEPVHCVLLVPEHTPHAPLGSHAGVPPWQSASPVQARQVPVAVLQTGFVPLHAEAFVAEHWPHAPDDSHAGVLPPQSTSPAHARHVCVAPLQTGVVPLQSAFAVQRTHTPAVTSHTGVPPVHFVALPAEHWPHAPEDSHAGVAPPQSTSPAHARHVCVAPLQTGVVPPQSAFAVQRTHTPAVVSQTGVPPVQLVVLPAEH